MKMKVVLVTITILVAIVRKLSPLFLLKMILIIVEISKKENDEIELRRSKRERKRTEFYSACPAKVIYVNCVSANAPMSYHKVVKSKECDLWLEAMNKELKCVKRMIFGN